MGKAIGEFCPTSPGESEIYGFDFTSELATDADGVLTDSLDSTIPAEWLCKAVVGSDPNAQYLVVGDSQIQGNRTFQRAIGGIAGVEYSLEAWVWTMQGNHINLFAPVTSKATGC